MRRLGPVELPAWVLPLLVAALVVPIVGGVLIAGPALGSAVAALIAAGIVVVAVRARYDEPIEVASSSEDRRHVLVVATATLDDPAAVEAIAATAGPDAQVLVLAPALNPGLRHWLSDLRKARLDAQTRLAVSLASLAAARVDAIGHVGDTDPVQAVEDELASFPAREVVFVTGAGEEKDVAEVRRRLDRPLRHLVVER